MPRHCRSVWNDGPGRATECARISAVAGARMPQREKLRSGAEKRAIRRAERTWSIKYRIHMGTARQQATGLQLRSRGERL
jgi:hypothetical protein